MTSRSLKFSALSLAILPLLSGCGGDSIKDDIQGKWVSTTCEVRPTGEPNESLYIKREYDIKESTWAGTLTFYADNNCTVPTIVALAEGPYSVSDDEAAVKDTHNAEFSLQTMKLTPRDPGIVEFFKSLPAGTCGTASAWALNSSQDVTSTKGCAALGVDLQNCGVEYELVKVVDDTLLVGARPADGSGPCTAAKRTSTESFQPALKKAD
ncbi:hypothetical protein [Stigmatella erecta]|uniref:Adenomatosis polyposis coli down-regulated 1 n=1 Tax=Stigmatella erecta TaxID=83460 RepID=A0A1I0I6F4_9BACT|nr:hypothetical protein [Stigmatella erecta]SET91455.1 Adenomatosis polyposis coli down-regulated 1 [Stigmatella erecta]